MSADLSSVLVEAGLNTDVGVNDQPRLAMSVVQITHKSNGRSSTERCHAPEHGISHWLICRYTTRPPAIVNVKVCGAMSSLSQATSYPLHNSSRLWLRSKLLIFLYSARIKFYIRARPGNELQGQPCRLPNLQSVGQNSVLQATSHQPSVRSATVSKP
jgi:hypothetical protein